jgi:hypothetical protein
MESSILASVKEVLGGPELPDAFDLEILTHINGALSTLNDLGVGELITVVNKDQKWYDLGLDAKQESMVRPYIQLKVRLAFDPPANSFTQTAFKTQIEEYEFRLRVTAEPEPADV